MAKKSEDQLQDEALSTDASEQTEAKETNIKELADVLKSIGALSHKDRLALYKKLDAPANVDRERYSVGITNHDATGTFEEIIKSL